MCVFTFDICSLCWTLYGAYIKSRHHNYALCVTPVTPSFPNMIALSLSGFAFAGRRMALTSSGMV